MRRCFLRENLLRVLIMTTVTKLIEGHTWKELAMGTLFKILTGEHHDGPSRKSYQRVIHTWLPGESTTPVDPREAKRKL